MQPETCKILDLFVDTRSRVRQITFMMSKENNEEKQGKLQKEIEAIIDDSEKKEKHILKNKT